MPGGEYNSSKYLVGFHSMALLHVPALYHIEHTHEHDFKYLTWLMDTWLIFINS